MPGGDEARADVNIDLAQRRGAGVDEPVRDMGGRDHNLAGAGFNGEYSASRQSFDPQLPWLYHASAAGRTIKELTPLSKRRSPDTSGGGGEGATEQ
jgi:hypothetical protein